LRIRTLEKDKKESDEEEKKKKWKKKVLGREETKDITVYTLSISILFKDISLHEVTYLKVAQACRFVSWCSETRKSLHGNTIYVYKLSVVILTPCSQTLQSCHLSVLQAYLLPTSSPCTCLRHYVGRSWVRIPMTSFRYFNWPNASSRTIALWSTQPLTEMSTRNLLGGKAQPLRKADSLTDICEPVV
jgi:hypothetical protein